MSKQAEFINKLQTVATEEGLARLRTLEAEFGTTLTRFPTLAQEMKNMIEAGDEVDYDELVPRVEIQLKQAAELSARLEMLTKEEQSAPMMPEFLYLLRSKISLPSIKVWEQEFDQQIAAARKWVKEEVERIRKEKENEARIRREQEEAKRKEEEEREARETERRRIEEENARKRKIVTDFDGKQINFTTAPDEVMKVTGRIVAYQRLVTPSIFIPILLGLNGIFFGIAILHASIFYPHQQDNNILVFIFGLFLIISGFTVLYFIPISDKNYIGIDGIFVVNNYLFIIGAIKYSGVKFKDIDSINFVSNDESFQLISKNKKAEVYISKKCITFLFNNNLLPNCFNIDKIQTI